MSRKCLFTLMLCVAWTLSVGAQNTVESIRKEYRDVHEWITHMMPDEDGEVAMPPEYYDLHVVQNLPGTGPHHENIRMFYGDEEYDGYEDGEYNPYPPHYLRFVTAKYNFAAREYYEEYLYDSKGRVMFIYALMPDMAADFTPYELRMWFDGDRVVRFTAKKAENVESFELEDLKKATFKEEYSGTTIPQPYKFESDARRQRAQRFLTMFKGIDENTYR